MLLNEIPLFDATKQSSPPAKKVRYEALLISDLAGYSLRILFGPLSTED